MNSGHPNEVVESKVTNARSTAILDVEMCMYPEKLFETIYAFQEASIELWVFEELIAQVGVGFCSRDEWESLRWMESGQLAYFDLRDNELIGFLQRELEWQTGRVGKFDLAFSAALFQYAVANRLIKVVKCPKFDILIPVGEHPVSRFGLPNPYSSRAAQAIAYMRSPVAPVLNVSFPALTTGSEFSIRQCMEGNEHAGIFSEVRVCDHLGASSYAAAHLGVSLVASVPEFYRQRTWSSENAKDVLARAVGSSLKDANIHEALSLLGCQRLLPNIVAYLEQQIEEDQYRKDIRAFFPTIVLDTLSSGGYSLAKLGLNILWKNFKSPKRS